MSGSRVLVADDEPQIRRALRVALSGHGYDVELAEDGESALVSIATHVPDVIVLDLMMPGTDGLEVVRQTRQWSSVPIIVLSARGDERDKVAALDLGADDYLTKPFGVDELLARLRSLLRRSTGPVESVRSFGAVVIDHGRHVVTRNGEEVHLTPTEYDLLAALTKDAGKVLTHRQLLIQVWGSYAAENVQQLRVYINYLRKKLEDDPSRPRMIVTEPGVGYRLKSGDDLA
jgi:two-component system KDP operon response regulator KdpE